MNVPFSDLPDAGFVRLSQVTSVVGLKKSSVYDLISRKRFPAQHKLTAHAAGWRVCDIRAWLINPTGWRASSVTDNQDWEG